MKCLSCLAIPLFVASCATTPGMESPAGLPEAVSTLPAGALAGMSREGRRDYLANPPGEFDREGRRIHYYADSSDAAGDPQSMFFLRLFEDGEGRTVAAAHAARPFADGRDPSDADTVICRLEDGRWVDITATALPPAVPGSWWFRFDQDGEAIPCGTYERITGRDGAEAAYRFGSPKGTVLWQDGRFNYRPR